MVNDCITHKTGWVNDCITHKTGWVNDCITHKTGWVNDCITHKTGWVNDCGWVMSFPGQCMQQMMFNSWSIVSLTRLDGSMIVKTGQ